MYDSPRGQIRGDGKGPVLTSGDLGSGPLAPVVRGLADLEPVERVGRYTVAARYQVNRCNEVERLPD